VPSAHRPGTILPSREPALTSGLSAFYIIFSSTVFPPSRYRTSMYRTLVLLFVLLLASAAGFSKCANRFIFVEGHIAGAEGSRLEIVVQTTPDANRDQPKITIQERNFAGRIYFDSTKSEGRFTRDDCSRVPTTVRLLLFDNGHQVDSILLSIERDFTRDKGGDFKMRSPVEFHLK
jgi:hypothetical protein